MTLTVALAAALVITGSAGAAVARWSAVGAGVATAANGTSGVITLTTGTASADLYPGASGAVSTVASSTTGTPERISTIAVDTTRGTGGISLDVDAAACPPSSFTFAPQTNGGAGWAVPATGALPIALPASLTLSATAPSGCQGVTITVALVAS
jgi:hypothetical protein